MQGLTKRQAVVKRSFDVIGSGLGLLATSWLIVLAWIMASFDTQANGMFTQERIGRCGRVFRVVKIRTMRPLAEIDTTVTTHNDVRITRLGHFFRRTKIDELPQLWNVLLGHMSFVGPRPDVSGYADTLEGSDQLILSVRPGITGPATLKYRDEESLLATKEDPETYNLSIIYPDKVRLNRRYVEYWSFWGDLRYIWWTIAR